MSRIALSPKIRRAVSNYSPLKQQNNGLKSLNTIRKASTAPGPRDASIPGNPPLPLSSQLPIFNVKIPDTSLTGPEPPVQVPYLPDFWESSINRVSQVKEHQPKLIVVAGADTHLGGGPSHNLLDLGEGEASYGPSKPVVRSDSFLDDILEDLQLPPAKELKTGFSKILSRVGKAEPES